MCSLARSATALEIGGVRIEPPSWVSQPATAASRIGPRCWGSQGAKRQVGELPPGSLENAFERAKARLALSTGGQPEEYAA